MQEKVWVDIDEFTTAWLVALVLHGHKPPAQAELLDLFREMRPAGSTN